MKAFLITTGFAFGALTLIHVWRLLEEAQEIVAALQGSLSKR